ncbi:hypothetical protein FGD71_022215 [Streptomyces sporangiiformans]|uniref:Uncharacterized protein n=1 Tax=Streptomyces sporangiiformans TaxID=2315329 RepID=A0A505DM11_9ACTN|nr:hypothetical protein FGD71_022215 [Streptomyces sporangiiformans]
MRRCHLGGGSGVRLAHGPQSSIDRLCQRSGNEKAPRTGGDAALIPATDSRWPGLISAAR